jgi:hypothetical protein
MIEIHNHTEDWKIYQSHIKYISTVYQLYIDFIKDMKDI